MESFECWILLYIKPRQPQASLSFNLINPIFVQCSSCSTCVTHNRRDTERTLKISYRQSFRRFHDFFPLLSSKVCIGNTKRFCQGLFHSLLYREELIIHGIMDEVNNSMFKVQEEYQGKMIKCNKSTKPIPCLPATSSPPSSHTVPSA